MKILVVAFLAFVFALAMAGQANDPCDERNEDLSTCGYGGAPMASPAPVAPASVGVPPQVDVAPRPLGPDSRTTDPTGGNEVSASDAPAPTHVLRRISWRQLQ